MVRLPPLDFAAVNLLEFVPVLLRPVARDFEDLGDKPASWPAFELDDQIQRVGNVGLDGPVWQLDATLKNAAREARKP